MHSPMSSWATSSFDPKRTEALTPKRHLWLILQPINAMLNYKILPYDHLKVLRTDRKTISWAHYHYPGGCNVTASQGCSSWHCCSSCPGQHHLLDPIPHPRILLAILFQWIRFPLARVFSLFLLFRQWVKQSCERKCQRAKWKPLLIYLNWQWICRWRKNWACAPFPRAELKRFNQKKVECWRKGEDKRFLI